MQVSVETGEGLMRRMQIDLPFERIQVEVDKRLQQIARNARLPGFRPGKVPMKVLRQRYGEQVQQEVLGELAQASFSDAVAQESLRPAGLPQIEPVIDAAEKRFGYVASFEVLPEIEPAPLSDRTVKRPLASVEDSDLEEMIERLRRQRRTWVPAGRPAETGDRLTLSFRSTVDGEPVAGGDATDSKIELGASHLIPGFEEGLAGVAAGESRTLDLTFPDTYPAAHLAGKAVRFEVQVSEVEAPELPALDEEFARGFGVADGDLERFRNDVRANMERELRQRIKTRTKEQVMNALVDANPVEIPGVLVREEIRALKEQMRRSLNLPEGGAGSKTALELPDSLFEGAARRRVLLGLLVAEIVKRQGIAADPERVRAEVEALAATYEKPEAVVSYYYADRSRLAPVESVVLEDQVVDWVLAQVQVEDEPMSFAQLTDTAGNTQAGSV